MRLVFAPKARRDLDALDPYVRRRILRKIEWFVQTDDPLIFADPLSDHTIGSWRFRVGDWRIAFDVERDMMVIHRIGHRSDVYR